jgi:peptide/nickel transport system permease protein
LEYASLILRRLAWSVVVLAGLSVVVFVIARMVPGDPARMALGPTASQAQVEQLRRDMGLDRPLIVQYGRYLSGLLRGDLGDSLLTRRPVARDLAQAFPATLELVVSTIVLTTLLGLPFGVLAARYKDGWFDGVARIVSLLGVVTPRSSWRCCCSSWSATTSGRPGHGKRSRPTSASAPTSRAS